MELTQEEYWYWFAGIEKVGRKTAHRLLAVYKDPYEIFKASEKSLRDTGFLREEQIKNILRKDIGNVRNRVNKIKNKGIKLVHCSGPEYPDRLKNIPDPPILLYYKGAKINDAAPSAAIVGSRKCSDYGRRMAYKISGELAASGVQIISGMAYGIDGEAQKGCLSAGGITRAVLGCGADICYPESNIELYTMIERGGSIISEYEPGTTPKQGFFPERNRIVSGLADVVAVIEAGEKSGSLITVDCALEQGKDVYAVPGRITDSQSRGCNALIKNGAFLLEDAKDILDALGIDCKDNENMKKSENKYSLATDEKIVYARLGLVPKHIDSIVYETGLPVERIMRIILNLEMKNIIRKTGNNYYVKAV